LTQAVNAGGGKKNGIGKAAVAEGLGPATQKRAKYFPNEFGRDLHRLIFATRL